MEYHLNMGINHIYIADNNDVDDGEILKGSINKRYQKDVTIYDYRGKDKIQLGTFNDFIYKYELHKSYDCIAFIDVDEFINLGAYNNIQDMLSMLPTSPNCIGMLLNYRIHDDNGLLYDDGRGVRVRFPQFARTYGMTEPRGYYARGKTIFNCKCSIIDKHESFTSLHNLFKRDGYHHVDVHGNMSEGFFHHTDVPNLSLSYANYSYEHAWLDH